MAYTLPDLLRVMERLRDPDTGCPWDLKQDFHTIVPSTLEECYELAQAIEQGDYPHVGEELGDVLFQVVFYAQMGRERGYFTFDGIVDTLVRKLVRRHPHVFAAGDIEGVVPEADRGSVESVRELLLFLLLLLLLLLLPSYHLCTYASPFFLLLLPPLPPPPFHHENGTKRNKSQRCLWI